MSKKSKATNDEVVQVGNPMPEGSTSTSTFPTSSTRPKPEYDCDTVQSILANASSALDVARELAPLLPVPFVGAIFVSAKAIVDAAAEIRQNKHRCAELAQRVANIARDVRNEIHGKEHLVDDSLKASLAQLSSDIDEIRVFMKNESKRGLWSRIVHNVGIAERVTEFETRLVESMSTFKTTSSIRLELKLEQVARTAVEIDTRLSVIDRRAHEQRKWDGQHRIYRMAEIDVSSTGAVAHSQRLLYTYCADEGAGMGTVTAMETTEELSAANIKGRAVVVRTYMGSKKTYNDCLTALKKARHNNLARLVGHSDHANDENSVQFMVFTGQYRRLEDHMDTLSTSKDRYRLYIRGVMSTLSGHYYLASQGLIWLGRNRETMFDLLTGEIILGTMDDIVSHCSPCDDDGSRLPLPASFVEVLPSLIQDWDALRDRAAMVPRSYSPTFVSSGYSASLTASLSPTVIDHCDSSSCFTDTYNTALRDICSLLIQRIQHDIFYETTERSARTHTDFPPLGGISVLNPENDNDAEDGRIAEDYTLLARMSEDLVEPAKIYNYSPPQFMKPWSEGDDKHEPCQPYVEYGGEIIGRLDVQPALNFLAERGPAIAVQRGIRLRNLGVLIEMKQIVKCEWDPLKEHNIELLTRDGPPIEAPPMSNGSSQLRIEAPPGCSSHQLILADAPNSRSTDLVTSPSAVSISAEPIYYHIRLTPERRYEEPWGYFHNSAVPLPEEAPVPFIEDDKMYYEDYEDEYQEAVESGEEEPEPIENYWYSKKYVSTMTSIRGFMWQFCGATFLRLHPDQADALEWIQKAMTSAAPPECRYMR